MSNSIEKKDERSKIRETLIHSYEILEEKLNHLNLREDRIRIELQGGSNIEKEEK